MKSCKKCIRPLLRWTTPLQSSLHNHPKTLENSRGKLLPRRTLTDPVRIQRARIPDLANRLGTISTLLLVLRSPHGIKRASRVAAGEAGIALPSFAFGPLKVPNRQGQKANKAATPRSETESWSRWNRRIYSSRRHKSVLRHDAAHSLALRRRRGAEHRCGAGARTIMKRIPRGTSFIHLPKPPITGQF